MAKKTNDLSTDQMTSEPPKKKRHIARTILIVLAIVIGLGIVIAALGGSNSVAPSSEPFDPNNYQQVDYDSLAKAPEQYENENLVVTGRVIQVVEGSSETDIRLATSVNGYGDVVFVRFDPSILDGNHLVEDQTVAVYGRCTGQETYTAALGQSVSIPGMVADYIDQNAKSQKDEQNEKIQALFDGVTFEKHDEGYGSYTYSATITNNTDTSYDSVSLLVGLYDADGTRLDETYASVNSWAAGESSVFSAWSTTNAAQVKAEVQSYSIDGQYYSTN